METSSRKKVEEFIICECGCTNHFLYFVLDYDKWSDRKYVDCSVHFYLNPANSFWNRLWKGIKYIFGYRYIECFDDVLINKEKAEKIINAMQTYIDLENSIKEINKV